MIYCTTRIEYQVFLVCFFFVTMKINSVAKTKWSKNHVLLQMNNEKSRDYGSLLRSRLFLPHISPAVLSFFSLHFLQLMIRFCFICSWLWIYLFLFILSYFFTTHVDMNILCFITGILLHIFECIWKFKLCSSGFFKTPSKEQILKNKIYKKIFRNC